ncbi:FadR/GntR family transcriptional regulator [Amycolatopsis jejuensis]|uniref:FadR/GntR family transcriptional regulator n=1 Tax=Amycolatopsis jejuensis TaxID=330084 RepID=UPI000527BB97|nr:FadR/GntR family transcriptional regulator [Amycolatopsis jejuensis]
MQHDASARPTFTPARPVRAYEIIVRQIEDAIYRGELRPGQRLPSEREMVTQFAVSRPTVREALRVLESSGLIRSRQGDATGGAEVQPFSPDNLQRAMTALVHLEHSDLADVVQFRMIIEGSTTYLAATEHTDEELARIFEAHERLTASIARGYEVFSRMDVEFHQTIADASHSGLLRACNEVVRGVVANLIESKLSFTEDRERLMQDSCTRHERVLAAIAKRDGETAARLAKEDMVDHFARFLPEDRATRLREFASHTPPML